MPYLTDEERQARMMGVGDYSAPPDPYGLSGGGAPMGSAPRYADALVYAPPTREQQIEQRIMNASNILQGNANAVVDPAMLEWEKKMQIAKMHQADRQMDIQNRQMTDSTDDIKEYAYAVRTGYKGTFQDWMKDKTEKMTSPTAYIQEVGFMEQKLGRPLSEQEMWLMKRGPYGFTLGDVPGAMIGTQVGPVVGGGFNGGGGGMPVPGAGGAAYPGGVSPSPAGVPGQMPPSSPAQMQGQPPNAMSGGPGGVPGGFAGQQGYIDENKARLEGRKVETKDWATQAQAVREQAMNLPRFDDQLVRLNNIVLDIEDGKASGAGFPQGRWGMYYDPGAALIEAEGNIQALEALQQYKLAPVTDSDLAFLKSQFPDALKNPQANIAIIKRGVRIMQQARDELMRKMDYLYDPTGGNGSLEGYDRVVWERKKKEDAEARAKDEQIRGGTGPRDWKQRMQWQEDVNRGRQTGAVPQGGG